MRMLVLLVGVFTCSKGLTPSTTSTTLRRSLRRSDLQPVSQLLVASFETSLKWWDALEINSRRRRYRAALESRFDSQPERHHFVVAVDCDDSVVAFVEAGLLPPPPGFSEAPKSGVMKSEADLSALEPGGPIDVPYLANLCVSVKFQRRGIAEALVLEAASWAEDQCYKYLFVSVDSSNFPARRLYEKLEFLPVVPPPELPQRRKVFYVRSLSG